MQVDCSIFFHNYYGKQDYWLNFFAQNIQSSFDLYYNIVDGSIYNLDFLKNTECKTSAASIRENKLLQNTYFRHSSNKGKDIGGKMVLLNAYLKLNRQSEYGLFLHDKQSLYKANNSTWANNLLKIADPFVSRDAIKILTNYPAVGIVSFKENIKNEYSFQNDNFVSSNNILLPKLQKQFNIYPADFNYIAGTMFWFRMKPIQDFFNKNEPLKIRELLEHGNVTDDVTGTYTHCWERLLSWIITAQGYKINTI